VSGEIAILAVSERTPTYYDFCIADKDCNVCCWLARDTFPGVTHSGDLLHQRDLLDYVRINANQLTTRELAVFISGYQTTKLTRFLGSNPAVLIANNVEKVFFWSPFSIHIILSTGYRFFTSYRFLWMLLQLETLQSAVQW